MATFYFNAAVNTDLATLGNWWMNSSYTIAATALPTVFDDAIINGPVSSNSGSDITLSNLTVNYPFGFFNGNSSPSGALTVTGVATVNDNAYTYEGTINGNCIFNNNSNNSATINGNCTFNDNSSNSYTINGNCTFNDNSYIYLGNVIGNCTFNDNSSNSVGTITGDCTFNNTSNNTGTITGDCTFNDSSFNSNIINGDCVFNNSSRNESLYGAYNPAYMAQIIGNASFYDDSFNYGLVSGSIIYDGFTGTNSYGSFVNGQILSRTFYFNAAVNNDWATLGNWWMNSSYTIAATALPTVFDDAIINGNVASNSGSDITLSNLTVNSAGFVFFSSLSGALTVTGVATFNDSASVYEGTINGNCIFNDNSYTGAIINGNCIFNDAFVGITGTINGDCTFNGDSFSSGIVIGDCIFNGNSYIFSIYYSPGIVTGNCTFNDSSFNQPTGTITGDCIFNNTSNNTGTITGNCTFNDNANNYWISPYEWELGTWSVGTVNGNCTFSLSSAALSIDQALAKIKTSDSITGTIDFKYEKGINGSSILGIV